MGGIFQKNVLSYRCAAFSWELRIYILFSLENQISHADYDFEENPGTIEHILPENGNEHYLNEFAQTIHESAVYRLGNYTILEDDKNRACEALPFKKKKEVYATSQYQLSQKTKWFFDNLGGLSRND